MGGRSASEIICLSVNHSITLVGKVWLLVMLLLRILVLLLAGYPLYQDEQERFVCNTIQPGCANVCYDLFSPVSLFRFWLVQLLVLCLPYLVFIIYVVHKVSSGLRAEPDADLETKNASLKKLQPGERRWATPQHFTGAYILHLLLRMLLEAGFSAAHYYLFGFYIPTRFLCQKPPCTTQVDCYISRPTEKTVMLCFMLGAGALCLLLNALDLVCAVKRSVRQRSRRKLLVHKVLEEEQRYYTASQRGAADTADAPLGSQEPEGEVSHAGSFRKKVVGKESTVGGLEHSSLSGIAGSPPPGAPGSNTNNGNSGYTQEEAPSDVALHHGSEVALFSTDPLGTPRAIRVSKRGRLKPPPPPRRGDGVGSLGRGIGDVSMAVATAAVCTRKVGQYTLVELSSGAELQASDDGADKRSEWV